MSGNSTEHLDRETMESLGCFFLTIGMVPRAWAENQPVSPDIEPEQFRGPFVIRWANHEPKVDIRKYCDTKWTRTAPTGWYLRDDVDETSWSDAENHRVEIVEDEDRQIIEFTISVDIRTNYSEFVDQLLDLARSADCKFFDFESGALVEPTRDWVLRKVQEHAMNHVVFDSSGKLSPN